MYKKLPAIAEKGVITFQIKVLSTGHNNATVNDMYLHVNFTCKYVTTFVATLEVKIQ